MAKGNVYRYFDSKEELLTAAIETLLVDTTARFESALDSLGGVAGLQGDPEKAGHRPRLPGRRGAPDAPGARALGRPKGHEPSADLARKVLRTLAETAGRPSVAPAPPIATKRSGPASWSSRAPSATVLSWAIGTDWPLTTFRITYRPDHRIAAAAASCAGNYIVCLTRPKG